MANRTLTASIIAKEAVMILDNELVMAKKVFRGYEEDFSDKPNGYTVGDTISVRRPADFTVRTTATASAQDVQEGKTTIVVDQRRGVDFKFTSQQLTLDIKELSERVIKPAMVQLANAIDVSLHGLFKYVPNYVGTPGQLINSFADFAKGPERLDEMAVPQDERTGVLCPADHWALVGSQTNLYNDTLNKPAYRDGETGKVGGVDLYMSQNVATLTTGTRVSTDLVNQTLTSTTVTWAATRDTNTYDLAIDGLAGATDTFKAGETFTIANCYAVNPVTKAQLSFLKQFTITADATASGSAVTLTITPPPIGAGAQQNCYFAVADLDDDVITYIPVDASTSYRQNMIFHKNAFALVSVPLVSPPGAVDVGRQTYKGTSVRVIPVYDGITDESLWRLDVLYGVKAIDNRLAVRLAGTA
jgi:hypothetical protein